MVLFRHIVSSCLIALCCCGSAWAADEDYQNIEVFTDVYSLIRANYVEQVDARQLIYGAIRGMLETLDPHSSFLTPEMYEDMQADTHGEFGGLGIEITVKNNTLLVVSPIEGTPADIAGIKSGDEIIEIDGRSTENIEIMEAVRLLRGPKGESVELLIQRPGVEKSLSFTLVRDIIQIESVKSRLFDNAYGYVRITQFQDRTAAELKEHLAGLRARVGNHELRGLILDLRNNPGGLLDQAVAVGDLFIDHGLIVYTEGRDPQSQLEFSARRDGTEPLYPLIVLINGGSASAAEIVSGALQDHGRAVIMGQQSFGKGSVQTIIPMSDDSGLRLTTARYFTPKGRSIQALGITPDIVVPQLSTAEHMAAADIREADLQNHFLPETQQGREGLKPSADTPEKQQDYQLQRALDLLKGIEIIGKNLTTR